MASWLRRIRVTDQTALREKEDRSLKTKKEVRTCKKHGQTPQGRGSPDVSSLAVPAVGQTHNFRRP